MNEQANMAARYEHEIPEGYEARIEGDKVIIELKETEDERIRKYIVKFVELEKGVNLPPDDADKMLAYLEKQKDQKPVEWSKEDERMFDSIIGDISIADKRMGGTPTLDIKKQWLEKKIAQGKKQEPDNIQWPKVSNCIHNCKNCQAKCLYRQEQYQEQPIPTTTIHSGLYGIKINDNDRYF